MNFALPESAEGQIQRVQRLICFLVIFFGCFFVIVILLVALIMLFMTQCAIWTSIIVPAVLETVSEI